MPSQSIIIIITIGVLMTQISPLIEPSFAEAIAIILASPELPEHKRQRYVRDHGLSDYDADWLTNDPTIRESVRRKFERDKRDLKSLGIVIQPKFAHDLLGQRLAPVYERSKHGATLVAVLIDHESGRGLAHALGRRSSGDRLPRRVQERPPQVAVDLEHDRREVIDEDTVSLLTTPQHFLRGLALLDVFLQQ